MTLLYGKLHGHVFKVTEKEIHFLSANLRVKVIVQKILKSPAIQSSLQNKHKLIFCFLATTFLPFGKFIKYHWHITTNTSQVYFSALCCPLLPMPSFPYSYPTPRNSDVGSFMLLKSLPYSHIHSFIHSTNIYASLLIKIVPI